MERSGVRAAACLQDSPTAGRTDQLHKAFLTMKLELGPSHIVARS